MGLVGWLFMVLPVWLVLAFERVGNDWIISELATGGYGSYEPHLIKNQDLLPL